MGHIFKKINMPQIFKDFDNGAKANTEKYYKSLLSDPKIAKIGLVIESLENDSARREKFSQEDPEFLNKLKRFREFIKEKSKQVKNRNPKFSTKTRSQ